MHTTLATRRKTSGWLLATIISIATISPTFATPASPVKHDLGESYVFISIHERHIRVRIEMATKDLNEHLGLGYVEDEQWPDDDVATHAGTVRAYIDSLWTLSVGGQPLEFTYDSVAVRYTEVTQFMKLHYSMPIDERPEAIDIDYRILFDYDDRHRGLVVLSQDFESGTINEGHTVSLSLGAGDSTKTLDLSGGSWLIGLWTFIESGAWQIWIGIDHILFLIALLLPAVLRREGGEWVPVEQFKPALINVVKIVTVFTVAHSITLVSAALGVIQLPSHIVEAIIAFSIAIAAFDILKPVLHRRILIVIFVFGLFHGFGFANVLGDVGLEGKQLLLSLFGFNVGVELGQIAIVCVAFPILFFMRKTRFYRKVFLPVCAIALILVSMLWVVERLFGFDIRIRRSILDLLGR